MKTLITAHSGCDNTPDNSIEFVEYALGLDVDALEVDVRLRDSCLIMAHDVDSISSPLADAFAKLVAFPEKRLNCDLKEPGLEAQVLSLAKAKGVEKQLQYSGTVSFQWMRQNRGAVEWLCNIEALVPNIYSAGDIADKASARKLADMAIKAFHEGLASCFNMNYKIYDSYFCGCLLDEHIPLSLWTPSLEDEVHYFLRQGVYNITTRIAATACELRRQLWN